MDSNGEVFRCEREGGWLKVDLQMVASRLVRRRHVNVYSHSEYCTSGPAPGASHLRRDGTGDVTIWMEQKTVHFEVFQIRW
jgi:hypothetical protein